MDGLRAWLNGLAAGGWVQAAFGPGDAMRATLARIEGPGPQLAQVRDFTLPPPVDDPTAPGAPARYHTPLAAGAAPAPVLVYFHGGGFMVGDLDTHDGLCRRLAAAARLRVISVAYRLAPAHRFPAAWHDACGAFSWIAGAGAEALGVDPARVAVGGDSAGGNLAAGVAQRFRAGTAQPAPAAQLLLYPLLQLVETNVKRLKALEGHVMSHAILAQVRAAYAPDAADLADARLSPLLESALQGLAPAYLVTAGLDPLHGEGRAYADRLAASGVAVTHRHYARAPHGFMQATAVLEAARTAVAEAGAWLADVLDAGRAVGGEADASARRG